MALFRNFRQNISHTNWVNSISERKKKAFLPCCAPISPTTLTSLQSADSSLSSFWKEFRKLQCYGSVRGFSGPARTEQGFVQTCQTSASEKKSHTEKRCNVSGELIYVPFRAALIQNVQPLWKAPSHLCSSLNHYGNLVCVDVCFRCEWTRTRMLKSLPV